MLEQCPIFPEMSFPVLPLHNLPTRAFNKWTVACKMIFKATFLDRLRTPLALYWIFWAPHIMSLQVFSNHLFLAVFAIYISIVASLSPMGLELGLGDHLPAAFVGAQLRLMLTIVIFILL
jgi:hypothetical protein